MDLRRQGNIQLEPNEDDSPNAGLLTRKKYPEETIELHTHVSSSPAKTEKPTLKGQKKTERRN